GGELIIPRGEDVLKEGDLLYFVSEADKLNFGMELLGHKIDTIKRVMINGGDYIGLYLARQLEKQGVSVKIIEKDPVVCSKLIRKLNKTIVLNESATERHFLEQENIGSMDAFISVTGDDEDNILSTLLAKSLGVPWSVTLSNQLSYVPLMSSIGIDVVVNPRLIATSEILHFVRRGKVLSVAALKEDIEIIEVEALESSDIVGKPLSKIKWPSSTIVLCVEHEGGIIVPSGDTTINPNDKILLLAHYNDVAKLEKMLTVKLEYF
ncbi:NAD-binding protein, partial [bacterium]|nr:NAD-binding protein [bacterium]